MRLNPQFRVLLRAPNDSGMVVTLLESEIDRLPGIANREGGSAQLAAMLCENGKHFAGLSVEAADWLRGHIYAAIALSDDPSECLVRAREDLRTSSSQYVLAGIARVLRATKTGLDWCDDLEGAKRRIQLSDLYPDFRFDPPLTSCCETRTSLQELDAALADLRSSSSGVCSATLDEEAKPVGMPVNAFLSAELQDQDGEQATIPSLLNRKPIVLALFYTRCMNPLKCSLTISRLARSAQVEPRFGYVGLSYDPVYDTPHRLRIYGKDRDFPFGADARLVRASAQWNEIKAELELQAAYGTSTVNSHAREVFLIACDKRLWRIPPDWLLDSNKIFLLCSEERAL